MPGVGFACKPVQNLTKMLHTPLPSPGINSPNLEGVLFKDNPPSSGEQLPKRVPKGVIPQDPI